MRCPAPTRRRLLIAALTPLVVSPAWADDKAPPVPTIRPGSPLTAVELGQLLDAQIWKFQVEVPAGATRFESRLAIRARGGEARPFAGGMGGPITRDTGRDVLIAIIPIAGSLSGADKVRVVVSGLGMTVAQVEDNPLKGQGIGRHELPVDQKDGSFVLIGGYKGHTISAPLTNADTVLSWTIETTPK